MGVSIVKVTKESVLKNSRGQDMYMYRLVNDGGMEVDLINYGGIITAIRVPDRNGDPGNVVLGFDRPEQYLEPNPFFGALIGRYGNRIANARFTIEGQCYKLDRNDGLHHLHGGRNGFYTVFWDVKMADNSLSLSYLSHDGEQGYPGNLNVNVVIGLDNQNGLRIDYTAVTDKATHVNLTSHPYFNLSAGSVPTILDHELFIDADFYLPVNTDYIPAGKPEKVSGTPFYFNKPQPVGARIDQIPGGYDHNYILNRKNDSLLKAADLFHSATGRMMEVYTTEPGLQFYSGNSLNGTITGCNGMVFNRHAGLCLETQHFPDSPNRPEFPSTLLKPGEIYKTTTHYRFSTLPGKHR